MTTKHNTPHVLIVGAGLGGLALAQCLRKQGISYEIFERDVNDDSRPQGWSIGLHTYVLLLKKCLYQRSNPITEEEMSKVTAILTS